MSLITKELKRRGAFTGILLTIGAFILNGEIATDNVLIELGKFGMVPVVVANAIMYIMGQLLPYLKELHESGVKGEKELKKITKELALLIVSAEALLFESSLSEMPFQLGATYALCEISEQFKKRGLGNGLTNLFILQLLKDIATESSFLFATSSITQIINMGALTIPMIIVSLIYNNYETNVKIVSNKETYYTTHHITDNISISLKSKLKHANRLPVRVAAAGTMPLMHALSFFMVIGLDSSLVFLFGAILVFIYVLETTQIVNTHEIANKLKKLSVYINSIRPGAETKTFLNKVLGRTILIGIPLVLFMGLYPFLVFDMAIGVTMISISFLVCEVQNVARQVKSYNLNYSRRPLL